MLKSWLPAADAGRTLRTGTSAISSPLIGPPEVEVLQTYDNVERKELHNRMYKQNFTNKFAKHNLT